MTRHAGWTRLTATLLFAVGLTHGAAAATDCGPYPHEFDSLCPPGSIMIAACRSDGNWVFMGCWEL